MHYASTLIRRLQFLIVGSMRFGVTKTVFRPSRYPAMATQLQDVRADLVRRRVVQTMRPRRAVGQAGRTLSLEPSDPLLHRFEVDAEGRGHGPRRLALSHPSNQLRVVRAFLCTFIRSPNGR